VARDSFPYPHYGDLNDQLAHGRPFFADIARDCIVLYKLPGYPLAEPKMLAPAEVLAEAQRNFDHWFPSAARRFELAQEAMKRGYNTYAAFDLHQVTERLYHCVLLVLTQYSPLCRARHNGLYAARRTMPSVISFSRFPNALAATGAA
jgi:uncharacterized protein